MTIKGRLKAIKTTLGELPVTALEKPSEVLWFEAAYRKGREVATLNRALSTLRAAINWGRFQDPPYLSTTPFHRFGANIKTKEETKRDRRIGLQEEQVRLKPDTTYGVRQRHVRERTFALEPLPIVSHLSVGLSKRGAPGRTCPRSRRATRDAA